MAQNPLFLRRIGGPLGLIFIALLSVAVVSVVLGAPEYFLAIMYVMALPIGWLLQSPDRDRLLATIAIVTILLPLLRWLRWRRNRIRVS